MLLHRFLITLVFSWIANPLGVGVAQWFGLTREPTLMLVLLASGACVPFQIFLNEAIAVRAARGTSPAMWQLLGAIVFMQAATCAAAMLALPSTPIELSTLSAVLASTAATAAASFLCTRRYYALTIAGVIKSYQAALFGAIPGLVALAIYAVAGLLLISSAFWTRVALVSISFLPTAVVWLYVATIAPLPAETRSSALTLPRLRHIAIVVCGLILLTFLSTRLRADVAAVRGDYAALIVVLLNSLASLVTTLTRALFFRPRPAMPRSLIPVLAVASALIGLAVESTYPIAAQVLWLFAAQAMIVALIEVGRRARGTSVVGMPES